MTSKQIRSIKYFAVLYVFTPESPVLGVLRQQNRSGTTPARGQLSREGRGHMSNLLTVSNCDNICNT